MDPSSVLRFNSLLLCSFNCVVCTARIDLGFIVEATSSAVRSQSRQIKQFLRETVRRFTISTTAARIGIITYASRAVGLLRFTGAYTRRLVNNAINRIRELSGQRRLGRALYYAKRYLFVGNPQCGRRRILIILTAGRSIDRVLQPAQSLKGAGVEIFSVDVGRVGSHTLFKVATDRHHVFRVAFSKLFTILRPLKERICYSPGGFFLSKNFHMINEVKSVSSPRNRFSRILSK